MCVFFNYGFLNPTSFKVFAKSSACFFYFSFFSFLNTGTRPVILIILITNKPTLQNGLCWLQAYFALEIIALPIIKARLTTSFFSLSCSGLSLCNENIYENFTERSTLDTSS